MTSVRSAAAKRPALSLHGGPDPVYLREIAVVGPGVVGLPMAALLASAELWAPDGMPTRVTVVQRASTTSGWKVGAINAGRSPIGMLEPGIDELVAHGAGSGRLRATGGRENAQAGSAQPSRLSNASHGRNPPSQ